MQLITTPFGVRATAADILADVDLTGRRMVVTGGASRLGGETARALAGAGAHVTIATRNPAVVKPVVQEFPNADAVALDLTDPGSVHDFCDGWVGPVDAVVAHAGVTMLSTHRFGRGPGSRFAPSCLGRFALLMGLHGALKAAGKGRVVVVSCGTHSRSGLDLDGLAAEENLYDPSVPYAQTKRADAMLALGVSRHWAADGITANACAPAGFDIGDLPGHEYVNAPGSGAATSVLLAGSPLVEGVTGRYFEGNQEVDVAENGVDEVAAGVAGWPVDAVDADRLWDSAVTAVLDGTY